MIKYSHNAALSEESQSLLKLFLTLTYTSNLQTKNSKEAVYKKVVDEIFEHLFKRLSPDGPKNNFDTFIDSLESLVTLSEKDPILLQNVLCVSDHFIIFCVQVIQVILENPIQ
jgi:hypothetical protein